METDPKSVGTPPPLWKIPDYFFFFFEPFPNWITIEAIDKYISSYKKLRNFYLFAVL